MTLIHTYNGSDLTNVVPLVDEKSFAARAEIGQAENVGVVADDPASALSFVGLKSWSIRETACAAGDRIVWHGYVAVQEIGRSAGASGTIMTAPTDRVWDLDLVDDNGYLSRIELTGTDCKRPTETVTARITWLLGKSGITGIVTDYGLVATSSLSCDPVDYTGRFAADVMRDVSLVTGFNFHVRWNETNSRMELIFLDFDTSPLDAADFRISNNPTDITYTGDAITGNTWPVTMDAKLKRDPQRIASRAGVQYAGGFVFDSNATTESAFGRVYQLAPSANVIKTKAAADALLARFLAQHDEQDERVTNVRVRLPAAELNRIKVGQLMQAKLTHLPGWTSFRYCRALFRAFSRPDNRTQSFYDVDLELVPVDALAPSVVQYVTDTNTGDHVTATWPSEPSANMLGVSVLALRGATAPTAYPASADGPSAIANYIANTDYTNLAATAVDNYGLTLARRYPITLDDTRYVRWSPATSLGGSSRPRSHSAILAGVTTIGTPVADFIGGGTMSATPASCTVHADGPGIIVFGMSYNYPGPADHVGWDGFTSLTVNNGTILGSGYGLGNFAPFSWLSYLLVSAAGDYSVIYTLAPAGYGDPLSSYNCARVGVWFG